MTAQQWIRYLGSILIAVFNSLLVLPLYEEAGNRFTMKIEGLILLGCVCMLVWQYVCDKLDARRRR